MAYSCLYVNGRVLAFTWSVIIPFWFQKLQCNGSESINAKIRLNNIEPSYELALRWALNGFSASKIPTGQVELRGESRQLYCYRDLRLNLWITLKSLFLTVCIFKMYSPLIYIKLCCFVRLLVILLELSSAKSNLFCD